MNTEEDYDKKLEEIKAIEENQVKTTKRRKRYERKTPIQEREPSVSLVPIPVNK